MNRKVYSKPSIAVVTMTSTPLLAAVSGGKNNDPIQYGGRLDGIKQFDDEPDQTTDSYGTKWYTAE